MATTKEVEEAITATANMSSDALAAIERLASTIDRVGGGVQPWLQEYAKNVSEQTLVQLGRYDHARFKSGRAKF